MTPHEAPPTHEALIIGTGFGGQCAAITLREIGIEDFVMVERRSFMGGTWCQNTYPGAAVDVQSPLYSLSSDPYDWSQMFAERDELAAYTSEVIDRHGLRDRAVLDANVVRLQWCDEARLWSATLEDGRVYRARFVINASGPLSKPVLPQLEGADSFRGRAFHTNAWEHDFDYAGKRVAVIGSGASAAQVIPAIASDVEALHVFQRTPHWVLPRHDRRFTPLERRLLRARVPQRLLRGALYWALETRVIGFKYSPGMLKLLAERPARAHLAAQVPDDDLRRRLTPDYTIGCKRVILSNTLYPALCRENVTLHTRESAIKRLVPDGVVTQCGAHVPLDLIVYATGYDATDDPIEYPVVGRDGVTLAELWSEFPRAYLGTAMPNFPNLFVVAGPNTGIGHTSALFMFECQMRYIKQAIAAAGARGTVEVLAAAEHDYTSRVHREMEKTVWKSGGCKSWYQSPSGHVVAMFPGFSFSYRRLASRFVAAHHRVVT